MIVLSKPQFADRTLNCKNEYPALCNTFKRRYIINADDGHDYRNAEFNYSLF